jgi:hypothetical protein
VVAVLSADMSGRVSSSLGVDVGEGGCLTASLRRRVRVPPDISEDALRFVRLWRCDREQIKVIERRKLVEEVGA